MKPSVMKEMLLQLVPSKEPVLLVGSPGVGKSDTVEQVTRELGYDLIVTHPVIDDPTDYKGMPYAGMVNGEPGAMFLPFGELWKMIGAEKDTVVFMDDLGQAAPAVQAAIMQLVLARRINGHKISDKVRFLAATNRRQDKAAVTGLITPLLDRFTTVLNIEFDLDDWVKWGIENDMPAVLMAFARFKPDLINKFEASKDMKKSPTPRSVAGVGRLINQGIEAYEVLAGAAGEGFATEFTAFLRTWGKIPSRDEIYMNPEKAKVPTEPDAKYAVAGSIAYGATPEVFGAIVKYINRMPIEFAVLCVKDCLVRNPSIQQTKDFIRWASDNRAAFGH